MSRRKPRFTPDPPPYGASNEQILAWVNAQLQRIEDYWPRDDGDRITALEELQSTFSGEWAVSGQSTIRFEGSVGSEAYAWNCANFETASSVIEQSSGDNVLLWPSWALSETTGKLYFSNQGTGLLEIDRSANTVTQVIAHVDQGANNDWHPALTFYDGATEYLLYGRLSGTSWLLQKLNISTLAVEQQKSYGSTSYDFHVQHETTTFIAGKARGSSRIIFIEKADLDSFVIGFGVSQYITFLGTLDFDNDKFQTLEPLDGTATDAEASLRTWTVTQAIPPTVSSATVATIDLADIDANAKFYLAASSAPLRDGKWWVPVDKDLAGSASDEMGLAVISQDGTLEEIRWIAEGLNWNGLNDMSSLTFRNGTNMPVAYDSAIDKFYYIVNAQLCRYDPVEDITECCTIASTDDWDNAISPQIGMFPDGNYMWIWDKDGANPDVEDFATIIARIKIYDE